MITIVFKVLDKLLNILWWLVFLAAVFSTLVSFNVLDTRNRIVWTIGDFLYRVTDPILRPIRNRLPYFGGIDFSPLVVLLAIIVARMVLAKLDEAITNGSIRPLVL